MKDTSNLHYLGKATRLRGLGEPVASESGDPSGFLGESKKSYAAKVAVLMRQ
jgi:hypothetical protein